MCSIQIIYQKCYPFFPFLPPFILPPSFCGIPTFFGLTLMCVNIFSENPPVFSPLLRTSSQNKKITSPPSQFAKELFVYTFFQVEPLYYFLCCFFSFFVRQYPFISPPSLFFSIFFWNLLLRKMQKTLLHNTRSCFFTYVLLSSDFFCL